MMAKHLHVAHKFPKGNGDFLAYAKHVAAMMGGSPYLPSPTVPIATLLGHIADLDAAEVVTRTRVHGAAAERTGKRVIVEADLRQLRAYIECVASQRAEDGLAVIASSGMSVKQPAGPKKAVFAVKQGKRSGSVRLVVRHPGIVTSFDWQSSSDGTHWIDAPSNVRANQDLDGLTPGTRYSFRYRTLTREGTSDWSDPLTMIVA